MNIDTPAGDSRISQQKLFKNTLWALMFYYSGRKFLLIFFLFVFFIFLLNINVNRFTSRTFVHEQKFHKSSSYRKNRLLQYKNLVSQKGFFLLSIDLCLLLWQKCCCSWTGCKTMIESNARKNRKETIIHTWFTCLWRKLKNMASENSHKFHFNTCRQATSFLD